jgi:putative nucleotidyltransferase-like protein
MSALDPAVRRLAVEALVRDRLAAEIAGAFAQEGIASVVLKGPALAAWLYPGELRPYGDADLMVAPADWDRAVALLTARGFSDHLGPMAHPRMESFASTAFLRGDDNLDLHCALHGLDGDIGAVWEALSAAAEPQQIGGATLRVPNRAWLTLHVALHAAHHVEGKPLEDLRRAIAADDDARWRLALALARRHDGLPAFAGGLRLVPEGLELARELGIEHARSVHFDLREQGVPTAEAIDELLAPGVALRRRLATILHELFPRPAFMRWWSPLAQRGPVGLLLSYPWRWLRLAVQAPRGLATVLRARRRARRAGAR